MPFNSALFYYISCPSAPSQDAGPWGLLTRASDTRFFFFNSTISLYILLSPAHLNKSSFMWVRLPRETLSILSARLFFCVSSIHYVSCQEQLIWNHRHNIHIPQVCSVLPLFYCSVSWGICAPCSGGHKLVILPSTLTVPCILYAFDSFAVIDQMQNVIHPFIARHLTYWGHHCPVQSRLYGRASTCFYSVQSVNSLPWTFFSTFLLSDVKFLFMNKHNLPVSNWIFFTPSLSYHKAQMPVFLNACLLNHHFLSSMSLQYVVLKECTMIIKEAPHQG